MSFTEGHTPANGQDRACGLPVPSPARHYSRAIPIPSTDTIRWFHLFGFSHSDLASDGIGASTHRPCPAVTSHDLVDAHSFGRGVDAHESDSSRVPTSVRLRDECMPLQLPRKPLRNPLQRPQGQSLQLAKSSSACNWCTPMQLHANFLLHLAVLSSRFPYSIRPFRIQIVSSPCLGLQMRYHGANRYITCLPTSRYLLTLSLALVLINDWTLDCLQAPRSSFLGSCLRVTLSILRPSALPESSWLFGDCICASSVSISCLVSGIPAPL